MLAKVDNIKTFNLMDQDQILNFKGYDKQVLIDWYNRNKKIYPNLLKSGDDFMDKLNRNAFFSNNLITQNKESINKIIRNNSEEKNLGKPLFYFDNILFVIAIFDNFYLSVKNQTEFNKNKAVLFSFGMNIKIVDWEIIPKKIMRNPGVRLSQSGEDRDDIIIGAILGGADSILKCIEDFIANLKDDLHNKRENILAEGRQNIEKIASLNRQLLENIKEIYDKDGNGVIDIAETHNQLELLLKENKQHIQSSHPDTIRDFVKIIAYLKRSQENLQLLYEKLISQDELMETVTNSEYLLTAIESHQLVSFNSMYLLNSLLDDDLFTFHEIREKFDSLRVFNSTYQNDISQQLKNVNIQLSTVTEQLEILNANCLEIVDGLNDLNWATVAMQESLESKLDSINQGVAFQNLIGIYQANKLRKIEKKN